MLLLSGYLRESYPEFERPARWRYEIAGAKWSGCDAGDQGEGFQIHELARRGLAALRGMLSLHASLAALRSARCRSEFRLFVRGGPRLRPRIPKKIGGKTPDFIIACGTLEFGVEVKRPRTLDGAFRALGQAGKQLRAYGTPGMIVLDLSERFRSVALTTAVMNSGHKAVDLVRPHFRREVNSLLSYVSGYSRSDKFSRISLLACYVRLAAWDAKDLSEPDLDTLAHVKVFNDACRGLVIDQAERIQDLVGRGIRRLARIGPPRR